MVFAVTIHASSSIDKPSLYIVSRYELDFEVFFMTKSKEKGKRMKPNPFQFVLLIVYA
jgi:hypothetical protein